MSQVAVRKILRWSHIIASLALGTYLYSPWSTNPTFTFITLYIVFPVMGISGLWMWNQGRIARLFGPKSH